MANLELSDAVRTLIVSELNRLANGIRATVPIRLVELESVSGIVRVGGGLFRPRSAIIPVGIRRSVGYGMDLDAVDIIHKSTVAILNWMAAHGFGICFKKWKFLDDLLPMEFVPIRNAALRAALEEKGVLVDDSLNFVGFIDDKHRCVAEGRCYYPEITTAIETTESDIKAADGDVQEMEWLLADEECKICKSKEAVQEARSKVLEAKRSAPAKKAALEARLAYLTELGKRLHPGDSSETKRARGPDVADA